MSNAAQTTQDLENIELSIEEAKRKIARKDALVRLEKNPDFKTIVAEGFLETHAIRQVMLKAHPGMQSEAQQKMLDQQITAVGQLKQFFIAVFTEGMNAESALAADEETREQLLAEDLTNE